VLNVLVAPGVPKDYAMEEVLHANVPVNEAAEEGRFVNQEWGIDFRYPKAWGQLTAYNEHDYVQTIDRRVQPLLFTAEQREVAHVAYHVPSGEVVIFSRGGGFADVDYEWFINKYQGWKLKGNVVSRIHQAGEDARITRLVDGTKGEPVDYSTHNWGWGDAYSGVRFSPNAQFIELRVADNIETSTVRMMNLDTGKMIIDTRDIGDGPLSTHWSDNEQVLVIESYSARNGARGLDGLLVSTYGEVEKLHEVITIDTGLASEMSLKEGAGTLLDVRYENIRISDDGNVHFSEVLWVTTYDPNDEEVHETVHEASYVFDSKTRELHRNS